MGSCQTKSDRPPETLGSNVEGVEVDNVDSVVESAANAHRRAESNRIGRCRVVGTVVA